MKFTGTSILISAAYLASFVTAQGSGPIVSITSPLANTKYKAGQEAIISWINPTVQTIPQIVLAKGPSNALQPVTTIATNVNAKELKYVWKIPFEIENGNEYAFELGQSPDLAFAGPFTIEGGVGGTLPASNGSSSSAPSSTPPSAAAPPANNNAASTPAPTSAGGSSTTSQTQPHNANASNANNNNGKSSGANVEAVAGKTVIALGLAAAIGSYLF
ncbi:hypothetical protein BDF20DRAFT_117627 [Mycotypha africana]|uniref:uncharacterized protein n=1 Tax=Mycotypha africana TaxID=64632 RepID=UPI0023013ACE|nr:uncharacterized protein BDF20DRAFT_117627 [Mycotypha africana]KAI8970308.1 hypothetical protein BDF20DRAFT_117627 [Mycotypha africana]